MLNTTSAHAVRQPRQTELLPVEPAPSAPIHAYAFIRAPLVIDGKPLVFPSARALARHVTRERAGRSIQLRAAVYRQFALTKPYDGVAIEVGDGESEPVTVLGWAWLGGGRRSVEMLQAALAFVDPPALSDADQAEAA